MAEQEKKELQNNYGDIKRCPICGSEYAVKTNALRDYIVGCELGCIKVPGSYDTVEEAVKYWNNYVQQITLDISFMTSFCFNHSFENKKEKNKLRSYWTTFCEHYALTPGNPHCRDEVRKAYLGILWDTLDGCGWSDFEKFQKYLDKWMKV